MKKIALLIVSIFVISISSSYAENNENEGMTTAKLTGTVVDLKTGEALTGVKISVNGTDKCVYTDFDGKFEIENLKEGGLELNTSYISYKELTEVVKITSNNSNIIELKIENIDD